MTARSALTVVGQVVGSYLTYGSPWGAAIGGAIGGFIGGQIDGPQRNTQALIDDLNAIKFDYGASWTRVYGAYRTKASPMWTSTKRPVEHVEEIDEKAAGGPGAENTTFTYAQDWLVWAPLNAIGWARIWIYGELRATRLAESSSGAISASDTTTAWSSVTFFDGNPSQMPWAIYEAAVGADNAVAFRHRPSLGFDSLDLGGGGAPPLMEVEWYTAGDESNTAQVLLEAPLETDEADVRAPGASAVLTHGESISFGVDGATFSNVPGASPVISYTKETIGSHEPAYADQTFTIEVKLTVTAVGADTGDTVPLMQYGSVSQTVKLTLRLISSYLYLYTFVDFYPGQTTVVFGPIPAFEEHVIRIVFDADGTTMRTYVGDDVAATVGMLRISTDTALIGMGTYVANGVHEYILRDFKIYVGAGTDISVTTPLPVSLADIVRAEALLEWSGEAGALTADDIDVTELEDIEVAGYATTGSPRETIAQLMDIYYFGCVCSDKLYFRLRGAAAVDTIPFDETGMGAGQPGEPFTGVTRVNDAEVAIQTAVTGPNPLQDYEPGTELSDRLVGESVELRRYTTPVVLTPAERKGRADTMVHDGRIANHTAQISLDDRHVELEPFDVVNHYDDKGSLFRLRYDRETFADGVHTFDAVLDDPSVLSTSGITAERDTRAIEVVSPPATIAIPLDTSILRAADNARGLYVAAKPAAPEGWSGWSYHQSADDVSYTRLASGTKATVIGLVTEAPAAFAGGRVIDHAGVIEVDVGDGTLSSSTPDAVLADQTVNAFAIGVHGRWMLGQFVTAALQSPGVYRLTGLLHGCRGTEHNVGTQVIGDSFIVLKLTGGVLRVPQAAADQGALRYWKAVSFGKPLDTVTASTITAQEEGLKPFAPVNLVVTRNAAGLQIQGDRRTRDPTANWLMGSVPLLEESEAYETDFADSTSGVVYRTVASVIPRAVYAPADQAADGVSDATGLLATMYQMSAAVGRGHGASVLTTGGYATVAAELQIIVGGTFAVGRTLYAFVSGVRAQHVTVGGDTNLAGAATALAAAIDALAGYTASAVGTTITIAADAGGPVSLSAGVLEPSLLTSPETIQVASGVSAGAPEIWRVNLAVTGGTMPPGTYRLRVARAAVTGAPGGVDIFGQFSPTASFSAFTILAGLCDAINTGVPGTTYGIAAANYGSYARVQFPLGQLGWSASGETAYAASFADIRWSSEREQAASPVVVAPQPQITYIGVAGAPVAGDAYHVTINGTTYNRTSTGGSAASEAAAIATLVDAHADVVAVDVSGTAPSGVSAYPGLIRITGVANAVPFDVTPSTDTTITLTASVVTPGV